MVKHFDCLFVCLFVYLFLDGGFKDDFLKLDLKHVSLFDGYVFLLH